MTVMFTIDVILYSRGIIQPFRLLRPWILLCRDREVRRVHQAIISMLPLMLPVMGVVVIYLVFFASVGVATFRNDYHRYDTYQPVAFSV